MRPWPESESERRFTLLVFEAFAMAALVLAAVGLYGVLAGNVSARLREIGVRSALGATRSQLVGMVVRQGLTLTAFGVVIGLIGAAFASRLLAGLLFGISRLDPWTYATVVALLIGVSLIAASLPAWRAARVDPSTTLRAE
jgi:putative ABC transport system permease protein